MYRKAIPATELQECALVKTLRKVLFLHAAAWGVVGLVCAVFPQWVTDALSTAAPAGPRHTVTAAPGGIFLRLLGVEMFILAMFMVLVAQKIESIWWWSWAFVIADLVLVVVVVLHVLVGLPSGGATLGWWLFVLVSIAFIAATIWGLFKASQDQPIIDA